MTNRQNGPAVPSLTTATTGVSDVICGGSNVILKDHISRQPILGGRVGPASLKQHLGRRRFHNDEEVKIAVGYSCKYKSPI